MKIATTIMGFQIRAHVTTTPYLTSRIHYVDTGGCFWWQSMCDLIDRRCIRKYKKV